jgi:hypothetical protein
VRVAESATPSPSNDEFLAALGEIPQKLFASRCFGIGVNLRADRDRNVDVGGVFSVLPVASPWSPVAPDELPFVSECDQRVHCLIGDEDDVRPIASIAS